MRMRHDERGFVLITAMIVLGVFMVLSFAMVTVVDVQSDQTGQGRSGEAAFNLAESVLQAEVEQLQAAWPATSARVPVCSSSAPQSGCGPGIEGLQSPALGSDYSGATWGAQAFEDFGTGYSASRGTACSSAAATTPCPWDAMATNSMWVRAWAKANGQTRIVVEEVKRRLVTASLPGNVVTAGGFYTDSSSGNPTVTATDSGSGVIGSIDVRCAAGATTLPQGQCLGWQPGQVQPNSSSEYASGYLDPAGGSSMLSADQIQSLIQEAQAADTYYDISSASQCPLAGTYPLVVVKVEGAVQCTYQGNGEDWNTSNPGVLVFLSGSVKFQANFQGLIYMANEDGVGGTPPSCLLGAAGQPLVTLAGSSKITGAIFVDGCGAVDDNDSGDGLVFSSAATKLLQSYAAATPVPSTFRVVNQ